MLDKSRVYIALLHSPMYNKRMEIITTSITNLDLHDIARAARTYEVDGFFVVHPTPGQRQLGEEILSYWREGFGATYNPDRREAFETLNLTASLDEVIEQLKSANGRQPLSVATDARVYSNSISFAHLKQEIKAGYNDYLLIFGTGWGLAADMMRSCDYILEPIEAGHCYNHLSVRSAVAIILDRLMGESWFEK